MRKSAPRQLVAATVAALCVGSGLLAAGSAEAAPAAPAANYSPQVTLPFTGLSLPSYDVAVDGHGNVYATDFYNNRVVELPATASGWGTQVTLPFNGLNAPYGVAVDGHGNVYVTDDGDQGHVLELPATASGWGTQVTLMSTGLALPYGVAVDGHGNVYVVEQQVQQGTAVVELPITASGWGTPVTLPFSGLDNPDDVAVDGHGNVYVADAYNNRVVEVPATASGWGTQVKVPFSGLTEPYGVTVDSHGDLYADGPSSQGDEMAELPATASGWGAQVNVPLTFYPAGIAVDGQRNVYLAEGNGPGIVELPVLPVGVTDPGNQSNQANQVVSLQIHASSTTNSPLTYSATGLPPGLSINSSTGLISGRLRMVASTVHRAVTVIATDTAGKTGSASFTWTVTPATGRIAGYKGECLTDYHYLSAPGTPVVIRLCDTRLREKWILGPNYSLISHGLCLTDPHWGRWRTKLALEPCHGYTSQKWYHQSNGQYVVAVHRLCLTDPRWSTIGGTQLIIQSCRDWTNQRWTRP